MLRRQKYLEKVKSPLKVWAKLKPILKSKTPFNFLTVLAGTMLSRRRLRKLMIRSQLIMMLWMSL